MIKIEFDLPEFEKELNVSVTLKKDGEVIETSSSLKGVKTNLTEEPWKQNAEDPGNSWKQSVQEEKVEPIKKTGANKSGGNMMDISF